VEPAPAGGMELAETLTTAKYRNATAITADTTAMR
jgi:hypothetical protein